jgi:hypothetical protein
MGLTAHLAQQHEQARACFERALSFITLTNEQVEERRLLHQRGLVYTALGQEEHAQRAFQRALLLGFVAGESDGEQTGSWFSLCRSHCSLGCRTALPSSVTTVPGRTIVTIAGERMVPHRGQARSGVGSVRAR